MTTPTRPGPVAYITLGVLIAVGFTPLGFRLVTASMGIALGRVPNVALFFVGCMLLCGAGGYGAALIVRYFRARESELRAELAELTERVKDVEDKAWWNDPESVLPEDDTVDLSNVRMLPVRKPPEKRSS